MQKYHALEVDLDYITEHVIMGIALEKWAYKQLKSSTICFLLS